MKSKALELVEEINTNQDEHILDYVSNGFCEGIKLADFFVWNDQNCSEDFMKQQTLSKLIKDLSKIQEIISPLLRDELDKFFAEKEEKLKELFPKAKMRWKVKTICFYSLSLFGMYNEEEMDDFMDVLISDFEHVFEGFKLEATW